MYYLLEEYIDIEIPCLLDNIILRSGRCKIEFFFAAAGDIKNALQRGFKILIV